MKIPSQMSLLLAAWLIASAFTAVTDAVDIPFMNEPWDPQIFGIGNSYTQYNDLYMLVGEIFRDGIPEWTDRVYTKMFQQPGQSLAGHLDTLENDESGGSMIYGELLGNDRRNWTYVVLQDQSQIPGFWLWDEEGTEFYKSYTAAIALDQYIRDIDAQTMFLMTWGRRDGDSNNKELFPDFPTMQGYLTEGYMRYVDATTTPVRKTYVAPAGMAFEIIYNDLLELDVEPTGQGTIFRGLYQNDGSHPSLSGSYVAALTIYSAMTGRDPTQINWFPQGLDEDTSRILQDAVSRTIRYTFETETIEYPWNTLWTENANPTASPTKRPTAPPTFNPTPFPINQPTVRPTFNPTARPTNMPTARQTNRPSNSPTPPEPTSKPSPSPTFATNDNAEDDIGQDILDTGDSTALPTTNIEPTLTVSTFYPSDTTTMMPSLVDSLDGSSNTESPSSNTIEPSFSSTSLDGTNDSPTPIDSTAPAAEAPISSAEESSASSSSSSISEAQATDVENNSSATSEAVRSSASWKHNSYQHLLFLGTVLLLGWAGL